ncbi:M protein repeat protein [Helicobacter pylori GAM117Ai]|nr:M protein repeat protein [Helicobacter pylori GAM117Ai]
MLPPPPNNNEELLKSITETITDLKDRIKKLEDFKLEDFEPLRKPSHFIGHWFGKSPNDTQENSKDAQKSEEALKRFQEENTELTNKITGLSAEKERLERENKNLTTEKDKLDKEKTELTDKNKKLTAEKENLTIR